MSTLFSHLPSVDAALDYLGRDAALAALPRALLRDLVNGFLDQLRADIRRGAISEATGLSLEALGPDLNAFARDRSRPSFRRVLNATGVVVHTNLGRSLLPEVALQAVVETGRHYANLEMNLATGKRGSRYSHVEGLLTRLTGAEAALVVNNNAAAVLLVLNTLAQGREVVVSRGELVEIGGSFRIPDVMARSGAVLKEVGTTNRTHLADYEQAVGSETAAFLKVHASNFRITGFTKAVSTRELSVLAKRLALPLMEDLGSGNLFNFRSLGLGAEPTVRESAAFADLVTFSGDKVLGGPQAGIIVGRREQVEAVKANPLNRALRIDKMTLAALEATLRLYLDPERAAQEVPTLRMILAGPKELAARARRLAARIRKSLGAAVQARVAAGVSRVGGGAFPDEELPTFLVRLDASGAGMNAEALRAALLTADPPLVGRIEEDTMCLDVRTLSNDELGLVAEALRQALSRP